MNRQVNTVIMHLILQNTSLTGMNRNVDVWKDIQQKMEIGLVVIIISI
nr:MAG TPA: hypothetical protein [Caudoviricetes sp.]